MRINHINFTSKFLRGLKKLPDEYKEILAEREKIFRKDCFDSRLKTHKLSDVLKDHWSFSVTHSYRIIFVFVGPDAVDFINIGDHTIY